MGFYQQHILPHLINLGMQNREVTRYRRQVLPQARGRVLEIGVGSGHNLPFYGAQVTHLTGLDPSPQLLAMAGRRTGEVLFPVDLLLGSADAIPLAPASVDTVVSTWTLCSLPDVQRALADMRRVLKPGGRFLFVEHGLASDPAVQRWQHRLTPCWARISGGCHLDRKIDELIRGAGFEIDALTTEYAKGMKVATFFYQGVARR